MTQQTQLDLDLSDDTPAAEVLRNKRESQWFDRKSIRIDPKDLAKAMIGFANADGGRIAIGIHNGEFEGIDADPERVNGLLTAAINFSQPPVRHATAYVSCINRRGKSDRILLLDIEASERIHRNQINECYLRIGDVTKRLTDAQERELAFDKHELIFDRTIVPDLDRDDLDLSAVQGYMEKIGMQNIDALLRTRQLYFDQLPRRRGVTQAGQLLFGVDTPVWSYIRYIRYNGATAETGSRSNIAEDIRIEGTLPKLIEQARTLLDERLRVTRLTQTGRFERVLALPEFAWLEAIVNAVTHRSYSLQGDGIRIRDFSDRLEIENPGRLPGLVRVQNIRETRLSRNPHIARVLVEMTGYVRELNEGVRRMFEEMERSGLRDPEYHIGEASVRVTLFKLPDRERETHRTEISRVVANLRRLEKRIGDTRLKSLVDLIVERRTLTNREAAILQDVTAPTARGYMRLFEEIGLVSKIGNSPNDPTAKWQIVDSPMWSAVEDYLKAT